MDCAREVVFAELTLFANINQHESFATVKVRFHIVNGGLLHARFRVVDDIQETR